MERGFIGLNVAVLAIGDALTIGDEPPAQLVVDRFTQAGHKVVAQAVAGDFVQVIRAKLLEWIADPTIDVVVATAGTRTEHAASALAPLVTKPLVGFSDLFRYMTFEEIGTAAMLVDADAAQCKSTFVFLLPASIGAVRTALDRLILPQLDYRTKPANLVMRMPRVAHVEAPDKAPEPEPWIQPKKPTLQIAAVPAPARPPARAKTMPPPLPAERSISRKLDAVPEFAIKEITNVGPAPAPAASRPKISTISAPLPMKLPAAPAPMVEELEATPPRMREFEVVEKTGPIPRTPSASVMIDSSLSQPIALVTPTRARPTIPPDEPDDLDDYAPPRGGSRKVVFAWLGIALAGAALAIAFLVLRKPDKDASAGGEPPGDRVAARTPPIPDTRSEPPPAEPPPVEPPPVEPPPVVDHEIDMQPEPAVEPPVVAKTPPTEPVVAKDPGVARTPPTPKEPKVAKEPREPKPPKEPKEPELAPVTVENGCDEVSCALDRYQLACCAKFKPAEVPVEPKPTSDLPEKIDRSMIVDAMGKMKPAVVRCGEIHGTKGTVKLYVQVTAGGSVEDVSVQSTPDAPIGACVATAIKKASFARTQNGGSFGYPFVF